jgi:acyl transferase domain-containing protein/NAD(P)H-dependent flavin oxidoreductase YrpB (nitropropane dioxygenase family)/phosphopantetheinyl transferase/NAD(P)-dependent dehydrogenase (short-subunit alcohol dehydrogenase family)/acyl carrier protein
MKLRDSFDLETPVLYVNPPYNAGSGLIEKVSQAGGLGIVDHATSGTARFVVPGDLPHGVRIPLKEFNAKSWESGEKLALVPLEDAEGVSALKPDSFKAFPVPVFVEVDGVAQALAAAQAGAQGLIARGNEGPGWVSETSGLVLLQQILDTTELPVFLQGGVGLRTTAGAIAAGATGVVLDVHLLLTEEAALETSLRDFLASLSPPCTITLLEGSEMPLRVYARVGTRKVRELRKEEESLLPENSGDYKERLRTALSHAPVDPDSDDGLLHLSDDLAVAKKLAEQHGSAIAIIRAFQEKISLSGGEWPFHEGSPTAKAHGTRLPLVQGPMAHVSDNPDFLGSVAKEGALPFLAMGNMPKAIAREALALAFEKTKGTFGVGLIGLDVNSKNYEGHLEIMKESPPPFAILAAGSPDLALRIEAMGTQCYFHCPAPAVLAEGLKSGVRRFVFEGCESGGHIGNLASLNLWSANLDVLQTAAENGIKLDEVTVLFAGGIATGIAGAFVAGMIRDLPGLNAGLQMGTAYLTCDEAVSTCAITDTYRKLTLDSDRTVVIGRTVNTRARAAGSPMATRILGRELERVRNKVPLVERKESYELDSLGGLRLASKGCAIDPDTATFDCPVFCDLAPDEQLDRGLYLMGQVVALLDQPTTVAKLHEEIVDRGRRIFESNQIVPDSDSIEADVMPVDNMVEYVEHQREPIAVVGIGLRLPGSDSPETYWDQIMHGRSGIVDVPNDRWGGCELYYDPNPKAPDKTYSCIGGFVQGFEFEPLKHRIPPAVAYKMDRTQQFAVTCVADALADAGLSADQLKGERVGIILGNSMGGENSDHYANRVSLPRAIACLEQAFGSLDLESQARNEVIEEFRSKYLSGLLDITEDSLPGELANVISGRVANVFNLEGPNFTVDAACASSLAAITNAVAGLRNGSLDLALTGGVDAAMSVSSFVKFCKVGALSPDGSRPFDEGANGFVMGEGAGIVVLKRLSDAIRDNDRVYATILETGSSSDGRGKGIAAPNAAGQERAIRACYEAADLDPQTIDLIEAHGTSTPVGDQTELTLLDRFFRASGKPAGSIGIGSVKSQIGHLKAAAGAAGIIKAILGLHHRTLPPTINVTRPSPCIQWDTSPLKLLTEPVSWEQTNGHPRRAGVSAFGFGGTNFHVVVQEHIPNLPLRVATQRKLPKSQVEFVPPDWPCPEGMQTLGEAWVLGAHNRGDLSTHIKGILDKLNPGTFSKLSSEHQKSVSEYTVRCGFAAADAETVEKKLSLILEGLEDPAKLSFFPARGIHISEGHPVKAELGAAFLFPGQGSQYPYMLRDLAERFPIVAKTFEEADEVLTSLGLPSVTSITFPDPGSREESGSEKSDPMKDTQVLQPLILTANTAIFRLLSQMGIHPVAVAGHSLGEYAACVAAGVFSFRDSLEAVAVRGREMSRVSIDDPGLMMGIPADARLVEEVLAEVDGYVVAANKNSPRQTVISGHTEAVKKAGELFKARGLDGVLIPVSAAFHSGVVAPAREPFMKTLTRLTVNPPSVPVLSNVTGDFYPVGPAAPGRIRDLLGKQFAAPVEWVKSMRRLYSEGIRIFLECGPKRVMTNLALDTLSKDVVAMPSNHPKKGGTLQLLETLAALAAEGMAVNFRGADRLEESEEPVSLRRRAELKVVPGQDRKREEQKPAAEEPEAKISSELLKGLLDDDIRKIASEKEFGRFLELQGEPIKGLIKSGYESFVKNVLPLEKTVRQVESEEMDFKPAVISGISAGLPSDERFPFDRETLDDLILGRNFIKKVPEDGRRDMLEKNVERLYKGPGGEAELRVVEDISGVIKLAGSFNQEEFIEEYGLDERIVRSMDVTTRMAIAAGLEALRDAGIPLMLQTRKTSTGHELPDSWALPPALRKETGVIFASAFPGMASLVDEVTRGTAARYGSGAKRRLIDFYTGLVERIRDDRERERITKWFTQEFSQLSPRDPDELYAFNRDFLLRVMSMAQGQLAQYLKAQGPNSHVDAACASTTQAILLARDWIRTGQAKRVIVIAADDVAGQTLMPWIGSGFLAMGAATTTGNVSEAALPFDDRRHGLILGSAAVGLVVENHDLVAARGMDPIASIEGGVSANSAFHGTRLDVEHISATMEKLVSKWEFQSGLSRDELAKDVFFMSHETYSPKRGGSSSAEIRSLRNTFGDNARIIPIANTKGFTGHTMGVGVEDVVALRCLQKNMIPPIPNLRQPDPEFADLNLSRGGSIDARYALRLAAGFGSQLVMSLYKVMSREENRIVDLSSHRNWLKHVTSYSDPMVSVENRTLKVTQRASEQVEEVAIVTQDEAKSFVPAAGRERVVGSGKIRESILALLAEKTGYPSDMLDTGLDLEADLGIDTVKQAEFISEVRETFDIPRIDGIKIADFPTIEHIITFVLEHTGRATGGDATTSTATSAASKSSGIDEATIRDKILELLSQKTGYPADMLDTGLDLEADLGIDTVKQAEFISEIREAYEIPRIEGLKISDFPTIDHIIGFVKQHVGESTTPESGTDVQASESGVTRESTQGEDEVKTKILSLLSEKTGYPADMLDMELDLEADLGIDTVKQAEFISEIRELFGIPRIEGLKIADFPTISHIIRFVQEKSQEPEPTSDQVEEAKPVPSASLVEDSVCLLEARLVAIPQVGECPAVKVDEVLIAGGEADLAHEVETALISIGYKTVVRINEPIIPEESRGRHIGIVNLFPTRLSPDAVRATFELYLSAAVAFDQGPAFLVATLSEDGAYGFENPTDSGYLAGEISGATKSFSREYPDTRVRMLDMHPEIRGSELGQTVARSLTETFPLETGVNNDGQLRAVRLIPLLEDLPEVGVKSGDVVLASGGGGGITAACLKHLAEHQSLTFVIFDLTPLTSRAEQLASFEEKDWEKEKAKIIERLKREGKAPTPVMVNREIGRLRAEADAFRNVSALRELGSEVIYRSMDIRDGEAIDRALQDVAEICGRVDVVIHAAGIDISRALRSKTIEQIENVVSVKVEGMRRLLESLQRRGLPPRRIVGFGSVSGRFGNLAQIDYSAANDGLAHLLRWADKEMDAKASIIDWAPWADIGMATRGSVQDTLEAAGIDFVTPQKGVRFLARELGRYSQTAEVMAAGRVGPFTADAFELEGIGGQHEILLSGQSGHVESIVPGEYIKVRVSLNPFHPLLDHHRIDRAAVLPGVGGMDLMRGTGTVLDPDIADAMFENLRFHSPVKIFKDDPFEVEIEVARVADSEDGHRVYEARITSWFMDRQGRRMGAPRLHHQCCLVLRPPEEGATDDFEPWNQSLWVAEEDIYSAFFHGPGFRFLDYVRIEGTGKGVRFRYIDSKERADMFADFIPAGVETAFQAGAAFGVEARGIMILPIGIDRVVVHCRDRVPVEGELELIREVTQDVLDARSVYRFNGTLRDANGNSVITLIGVEMAERGPSPGFPGRVFEEIVPVERVVSEFETNSGDYVKDALNDEEVREHREKATPKRAGEWLAGRVAAKRSVQRLLTASEGTTPPGKSIRIIQDDQGKPSVELTDKPGTQIGDVSLSHSNGLAMAAAADPQAFEGLGVDMEKIEVRSEAWIADYFTDQEIGIAGSTDDRWLNFTRMWCLKEAALKAMGTGLSFDLKNIRVTEMSDSGIAHLELHNDAAKYFDENSRGTLEARVEKCRDLVVARVLIRS